MWTAASTAREPSGSFRPAGPKLDDSAGSEGFSAIMTRWLNYAWGTSHCFSFINLLMMPNSRLLIFVMAKPDERKWLEWIWWSASFVSGGGYIGLRILGNRHRQRLDTDSVYYLRNLRWDTTVSKVGAFLYSGILFHVLGFSREVSLWLWRTRACGRKQQAGSGRSRAGRAAALSATPLMIF